MPVIAGLTPVASHTTRHGAFALFAISQAGLELLDLTGANRTTSGGYTLHLFVAGDVNGDGTVDGNDAQLLPAAMGTSVGPARLSPGRRLQPGRPINADRRPAPGRRPRLPGRTAARRHPPARP